jgi:glycosyltransferase involved in cell wall biosynthesis
MDLSVIIPCYNQEKYIGEAIDSVRALSSACPIQTEIIIVDDCSTDDSVEFIKRKVSFERISNVKMVQLEKNSKLPAARNAGMAHAVGKYIICLDGDDRLPKNYYQSNLDCMLSNNVDIVYNPSKCFGAVNHTYPWSEFNAEKLRRSNFINAAAMYKKEVWDKVNGYDEELIYGWEDYSFWLKALKEGFTFKRNMNTFLFWRQHNSPTQMTQSVTKNKEDLIKQQLKEIHKDFYLG